MIISVNQLTDYLTCPVLYHYKHVSELQPPQPKVGRPTKNSVLELYDIALHKTISFIFHSMQDGFYPGLHHLSNKWGHVWVKPRSLLEDIRFRNTSWRDTHEHKRKQGWTKLQEIHAHYREKEMTPIMVDYPYEIAIGHHTLIGTIDLVSVVKNDKGREEIVMTEFITDGKNTPFLHFHRDWQVTAASYAFRKLMNVKEEKIVYHGIISGKHYNTKREAEDYKQLLHLLNHIEKVIEQGVYYPIFNERCITCPYQKYCEKGWYHATNQE